MSHRLPPDAFERYVALGPERSYEAVAKHFGVAKITVTRRAKEEGWQGRVCELDAKAREESQQQASELMKEVRERQLKSARLLQAKSIDALTRMPPEKAVKAATALAIGWKHELLLLGEPTERNATVEETIKREYERWMVSVGDDEAKQDGDAAGGDADEDHGDGEDAA